MKELLYVTGALIGVLGIMFLTFFALRMFTRRISTSGGRLRVIDKATLGQNAMILVVSVCGELMLIGVSSQRVEKLSDLNMTEEEYKQAAFSAAQDSVLPFSDILSSIGLKKKNSSSNGRKNANEDENSTARIEGEIASKFGESENEDASDS